MFLYTSFKISLLLLWYCIQCKDQLFLPFIYPFSYLMYDFLFLFILHERSFLRGMLYHTTLTLIVYNLCSHWTLPPYLFSQLLFTSHLEYWFFMINFDLNNYLFLISFHVWIRFIAFRSILPPKLSGNPIQLII